MQACVVSSLSQPVLLSCQLNDGQEWLLTTAEPQARQYLAELGASHIEVVAIDEVLNRQYGGWAWLGTG